jgi:hypothetical protein
LNFVHRYPVGGFGPDIADFGVGCMSGLKPPTYNFFDH